MFLPVSMSQSVGGFLSRLTRLRCGVSPHMGHSPTGTLGSSTCAAPAGEAGAAVAELGLSQEMPVIITAVPSRERAAEACRKGLFNRMFFPGLEAVSYPLWHGRLARVSAAMAADSWARRPCHEGSETIS